MLLTVGLGVGGTEGQILEIASRLDRRRFDVCVCALKRAGTIADELHTRGVQCITLDGRGIWDIRVFYRLFKLVRGEKPDVLHSFLFWANVASRIVGRVLSVPIMISSYRDSPLWTSWYRQVGDRLTGRWAHAVTCCSDAVRRLAVVQLGGRPERYFTIHNGVDLAQFDVRTTVRKPELGLRENIPVVGTICRLLEPKKGLTILLRAMAKLVADSSSAPCQLLIVGDGPAYGQLVTLSERLGIARWVAFAGMRRDTPAMLGLMDVFVLPSIYEGFGIAIVEAMAASRPVVATSVGGVPEVVFHGETGLLVPPRDPDALAQAIQYLLTHQEKAAALGVCGKRRAQELFSIDRVVKEHEELYEALLVAKKDNVCLGEGHVVGGG